MQAIDSSKSAIARRQLMGTRVLPRGSRACYDAPVLL